MGQIDWETTGAIGLGILIAASAASLGVWKTTVERKTHSDAVAAADEAAQKRRPPVRPGDDPRRLRARPQAPGGLDLQNLPPGHPPVNLPTPANAPKTLPGQAPVRPSPAAPPLKPVQPSPVAPKPAAPPAQVPAAP